MEEHIKRVNTGVDTLILNVCYSDSKGQPVKQELDEKLVKSWTTCRDVLWCERFLERVRRECLDPLILYEKQLRRVL